MKTPVTIAAAWNVFNSLVLPVDADPIQKREMKRCFYAGAQSMMDIIMKGLSAEEEATDEDMKIMDNVQQELVEFGKAVQRGDA